MQEETNYKTRDMNLSACLMVEGVRYLGVEKDEVDPKRLIFIFEAHSEIDRIIVQRANSTHIVSSVNYDNALRSLKSIIHRVRQ
jgi:hypothetical protein